MADLVVDSKKNKQISVFMIPVYDSKKEKKAFLSMTELVVDSKENKPISDDGEGVEQKELMGEKDISEATIPVDDTKRQVAVDKREEMQIPYHAKDVKSNKVAAENNISAKEVELEKEAEQEKDVSEDTISIDDTKREEKIFF